MISPTNPHLRDGDRRLDACGVGRFDVAATVGMVGVLDLLGSMARTAASMALTRLIKAARARLGIRLSVSPTCKPPA